MSLNLRSPFNLGRSGLVQPGSTSIGGIPLGTQGTTGIYSGYTLLGGDDFNGGLNVLNVANPYGRYAPTHVYGAGARSVSGLLARSYDVDPYHTGAQDSNRGVPINTTNMTQSSSLITLKARIANGSETPYINGRAIVSSMIHTGGYVVATAPCIVEAYVSQTSPNPAGWHPTFWLLSASPLDSYDTAPSPGGLEYDFPECSSTQPEANFNTHGTTIGPATNTTNLNTSLMGSGLHLYSLVMTGASVLFYVDGTLVKTLAQDATNTNRPYYILFTNHTYDNAFGGDSGVNLTQWTSYGATGATMAVDYYRLWLPNAQSTAIVNPTTNLPTLQTDFNTPFSYTFPSTASLFGSGVTDYPQAMKHEDFEPGATGEGSASYLMFPPSLTWTSGTRTLSGTVTTMPGRLHLISVPYKSGGSLGYVARGYIDVGPTILATTFTATVGLAFSYDVYANCPCGILLPKTLTVTGLPTGLSFSATTGLITGTPTTAGSYSVVLGVTNVNGQAATKTITMTVAAAASLAIDGASITAQGSSVNTLATTITTSGTNEILTLMVASTGISANPSNTSVTDNRGLTWTKRTSVVSTTTGGIEVALWWALAPTAQSYVVTANFASLVGCRTILTAVSGANTTTPFDTNVSLPATFATTSSVTTASQTISTTHANDMVLAYIRGLAALGTITEPSGFTNLVNAGTAQDGCYQIVSSTLASQAVTYNWTVAGSAAMIVDVIQGA